MLDKAFLTRDFELLVVVTDDPHYRSKLTTFTLEHALIQTLTLLLFYKTLTRKLEEEIKLIAGPWGAVDSCHPYKSASEKASDIGCVSESTIYRWRRDFERNGHRFSESLLGKAVHSWILDNPTMKLQAKRWLRHNVGRKAKKGQAVFQICDFQDYLNDLLLPQ